jgi:spherulation-specific family 4 protein
MAGRSSRRRALVVGAALLALLVGVIVARTQGGPAAPGCRQTLIPAYVQPTTVMQLVAGSGHPRLLILNPASGPGTKRNADWARAVRMAQRAGTRVIGYVHTGYGARSAAEAKADVARYESWYGVDGIFFDEAAHSAAELSYYAALADDVHARSDSIVALNPGVVPTEGYFDVADLVVTFEGSVGDYAKAAAAAPAWLSDIPRDEIAHLVYGASVQQMRTIVRQDTGAGYLYVTPGTLPDPWQAFAPYLNEEEGLLARCS